MYLVVADSDMLPMYVDHKLGELSVIEHLSQAKAARLCGWATHWADSSSNTFCHRQEPIPTTNGCWRAQKELCSWESLTGGLARLPVDGMLGQLRCWVKCNVSVYSSYVWHILYDVRLIC